MNIKKFLIVFFKLALTIVVLYFLGRQVFTRWESVESYSWQLDYWPLLLSVGFALAAFFIFSSCWRAIIAGFGPRVSYPMGFKISYLSNLGRYIPGKIWQVFGILYLAKKEGVKPEQAAASFVLIQLFAIPSSFLVYVLAGQIEQGILIDQLALAGQGIAYILAATLIAVCALVVFYPYPFIRVANYVLQKLGRSATTFVLDKRVALLIFLGYFFGWICYGLAYWLFLVAVLGNQGPNPIAAVGLFNGAYQVGYLMLFAPGGFGPRELVMGMLLTPFVGQIGAALAIAARLWAILIETVAAVIALAIKK
jgi:uncharacterized membrane protein YbhN (UPF0104 family)